MPDAVRTSYIDTSFIDLRGPSPDLAGAPLSTVFSNVYPPQLPTVTTSTTETSTPNDLLTVLPWLKTILDENGILSLPSGELTLKFCYLFCSI